MEWLFPAVKCFLDEANYICQVRDQPLLRITSGGSNHSSSRPTYSVWVQGNIHYTEKALLCEVAQYMLVCDMYNNSYDEVL